MSINVNWVPGITLEEMEKQCILAAFRFYRGNKTQTAGVLGIAIRTLENKLEKYEADNKRADDQFDADRLTRDAILAKHRGLTITQQNGIGSSHQLAQVENKGDVHETHPGVYEQPIANTSPKHAVPLPERKEVQSVLPKQSAPIHSRRGR